MPVCGWMMRYTALRTEQACGVIEDLVLFIYSVQLSYKFY